MSDYLEKYFEYKEKYLNLKKNYYGGVGPDNNESANLRVQKNNVNSNNLQDIKNKYYKELDKLQNSTEKEEEKKFFDFLYYNDDYRYLFEKIEINKELTDHHPCKFVDEETKEIIFTYNLENEHEYVLRKERTGSKMDIDLLFLKIFYIYQLINKMILSGDSFTLCFQEVNGIIITWLKEYLQTFRSNIQMFTVEYRTAGAISPDQIEYKNKQCNFLKKIISIYKLVSFDGKFTGLECMEDYKVECINQDYEVKYILTIVNNTQPAIDTVFSFNRAKITIINNNIVVNLHRRRYDSTFFIQLIDLLRNVILNNNLKNCNITLAGDFNEELIIKLLIDHLINNKQGFNLELISVHDIYTSKININDKRYRSGGLDFIVKCRYKENNVSNSHESTVARSTARGSTDRLHTAYRSTARGSTDRLHTASRSTASSSNNPSLNLWGTRHGVFPSQNFQGTPLGFFPYPNHPETPPGVFPSQNFQGTPLGVFPYLNHPGTPPGVFPSQNFQGTPLGFFPYPNHPGNPPGVFPQNFQGTPQDGFYTFGYVMVPYTAP